MTDRHEDGATMDDGAMDDAAKNGGATDGAARIDANQADGITRRRFVQTSAALAAGAMIPTIGSSPAAASVHASGSDIIRVGLIGCGGRGSGAASQALKADPGARLVAVADVFAERTERALSNLSKSDELAAKIAVDDDHRFVGFDAYQKLIDSGVDVVLLATPPVYRPAHLAAAVQAGKHVFCEKPMAVDAPGVRSVIASVQAARDKKLSLVSGFCWRYSTPERETFQRINDGAIGKIRTVYTNYNTGTLGTHARQEGWSDLEWQLRNWQHFTWSSGDHIVEQACHSIDKLAWAMNGELPQKAYSVGGRQARTGIDSGNVYDHFSVTYEFKDGVKGFHMCRQMKHCPFENNDYVWGEKGICEINGWAPRHVIKGETNWRFKGEKNDMYQQEHDELFQSIRNGEPINDGDYMTSSTLMAIMGRMTAYTGQTITWDQAMQSQENLLLGKPETWGAMPVDPIAVPGVTPFV